MTAIHIDANTTTRAPDGGSADLHPGLLDTAGVFTGLLEDLAARSDNRFVLAVGSAGSGKTSLLDHVRAQRRPDQFVGIGRLFDPPDLRAALGDAIGQVLAEILSQRPGSRDARDAAEGAARFSAAAMPHVEAYAAGVRPSSGVNLWTEFLPVCRLLNLVLDGLPGRSALILVDDLHRASPEDQQAMIETVGHARANGVFVGLGATSAVAIHGTSTDPAALSTVELPALSTADVAHIARTLDLHGRLTADGAEAARAASGSSVATLIDVLGASSAAGGPIDRATVDHVTAPPSPPPVTPPPATPVPASLLPALSGTARRYLVALVRLGPEATAATIAQALGDGDRFGAEGSAFAPVLGDLVARGLVQADAHGRLALSDPSHAAPLLTEA